MSQIVYLSPVTDPVLTFAALLSTPGLTIHDVAQQCVLQGDEMIPVLGELMDQLICVAPEHRLAPE